MHPFILNHNLLINKRFYDILKRNNLSDLDSLMEFKGGVLIKRNKYRSVTKFDLIEDGHKTIFYLKRHFWPWREKLKAIMPHIKKEDARNEWNNLLLLERLGFNTMTPVAFGEKKRFGMPCFSLTLTENIYDAERLEDYFTRHFTAPLSKEKIAQKRALIKRLSGLAKDFHGKGLNHQDFYLGHFFIRQRDGEIFIIDIQRVHQRGRIRRRDMIKDLAQLAFSAKGTGVFSRPDFMRFIHEYLGTSRLDRGHKRLIRKIRSKTAKIERHTVKLLERRKKRNNPDLSSR